MLAFDEGATYGAELVGLPAEATSQRIGERLGVVGTKQDTAVRTTHQLGDAAAVGGR